MLARARIALLGLLAGTAATQAQPPQPKPPEKLDSAAEKWLTDHLKSIADDNLTIRSSARAAVVSIGPQALPALRVIAEGRDTNLAAAARAVIDRINDVDPMPMRPRDPNNPNGNRPMGGPGKFIEDAIATLDLKDEQKPKVQDIIAEFHRKIMLAAEKARGDGDRPDPMLMREPMKKINEEMFKELTLVLEKDQLESLRKVFERGPRPPEGRPPEKRD